MWNVLIQLVSPGLAGIDGVGTAAPYDATAALNRYQNLKATSSAVSDYGQKVHDGTATEPLRTEAAKDLVALSSNTDLTSPEVARVKEILAKVEGGKPLDDADVKALKGIVERLQGNIVAEEKAVISGGKASRSELEQLAVDGVTMDVESQATDALVKQAQQSKDPAELAALIEPAAGKASLGSVLSAVATNPHTPPEVLARILEKSHANFQELALLTNPNTPLAVVQQLANSGLGDEVKETARLVMQVRQTSDPEALEKLAAHADKPAVRYALAANPATPAAVLAALADPARTPGTDEQTQLLVAKHPEASVETLRALYEQGQTDEVKQTAHTALVARATSSTSFAELAELAKLSKDPDVRRAVAGNKATGKETLAALADAKKTPDTDADTQILIANNPNTSLETLISLRKHGKVDGAHDAKLEATARLASRGSVSTSATELQKLADLDDPMINQYVSSNTMAKAEDIRPILIQISKSKHIDVATQESLAANPQAPIEVLRKLSTSGLSADAKQWATENMVSQAQMNADPKVLLELVKEQKSPDIRLALAQNPLTPPEALQQLVKDPTDAATQTAVAQHPWAPSSLIDQLTKSKDPGVKAAAEAALLTKAQTGHHPMDDDLKYLLKLSADKGIREGLAANPNATPDVLRTLADPAKTKSTDAATQVLIASNPHAPVDVLITLSKSADAGVKAAADQALLCRAQNSTDAGQLRQIAALSADPAVLKAIAENRTAPPDVLAALVDPKRKPPADPAVMLAVAGRDDAAIATLNQLTAAAQPEDVRKSARAALDTKAAFTEDAAALKELAKDVAARDWVIGNAATPADLLATLADKAKSPDVTPKQLAQIATHPHTPIATLRLLCDAAQPEDVRKAAAAALVARATNSSDPAELRELLKDAKTADVRQALAANPKAPADVLLGLVDKAKLPETDEATQKAVLANPGVTSAVLKQLEKDGATDDIKKVAKDALAVLATAGDVAASKDKLRALAANPPSREVEAQLLANPSVPNEAVAPLIVRDNQISPDEIQALRQRVMSGAMTEADVAQLLAKAGLAPDAAQSLAGWLTKEDAEFKLVFGAGGKSPLTVRLQPGANGLELVSPSGYDPANKPGTVEPGAPVDPLRVPAGEVKVTGPKEGKFTFDGGGKVDALTYTVELRGKKVEVIFPKNGTATGELPSLDQVVKSLSLMPAEELAAVKKVAMNPEQNPDDKTWAIKYKDADFNSYATGGGGVVNFFPSGGAPTQESIDSTILHEGAHNLSRKLDKFDEKAKWKDAMAADGAAPSDYADSSSAEDFAEAVTLYLLGGMDDPAVRAKFGRRFAVLDELFAKGKK